MDHVPLLFAESVARLFDINSLHSLKESRSRLFGNVGRSFWEKRLQVTLNVVYNPAAGTFDYCLTCRKHELSWSTTPNTYNPADDRFVYLFEVSLLEDKSSLDNMKVKWASATPSDPTFLKLLRATFRITKLRLDVNCPKLLKLLPDYCTFNWIHNYGAFAYNGFLEAIIQRSQESGRLESVHCKEFFEKRGIEASIDWISTNKRLRRISRYFIRDPASIRTVLNSIGVH